MEVDMQLGPLSELEWQATQLAFADGGMGIPHYEQNGEAGYLASMTTSILYYREEGVQLEQFEFYTQYVEDVQRYLYVQARNDPQQWGGCTVEHLLSLMTSQESFKLQSFLNKPYLQQNRKQYEQQLRDLASESDRNRIRLANFISSSTKFSVYPWLSTIPTEKQSRLTNIEFVHSAKLRLGSNPSSFDNNLSCVNTCNQSKVELPHLMTCNRIGGGNQLHIHNGVCHVIQSMGQAAGLNTQSEPVMTDYMNPNDVTTQRYFQSRVPVLGENPTEEERTQHATLLQAEREGKRGDILLFDIENPTAPGREPAKVNLVVDVSITNPGCKTMRDRATRITNAPGICAADRAATKTTKYQHVVRAAGMTFLPFIMESPGYMTPDSWKLFKSLCKGIARKVQTDYARTLHYWLGKLATTLQKRFFMAYVNRRDKLYKKNSPTFIKSQLMAEHIRRGSRA